MQTIYTYTYLERCTLVGKRTIKKRMYEHHYAVGHISFESIISVCARHQVGAAGNMVHVDEKAPLKQTPHVVRSVYFFHFNLCIDVTVIQKTNICLLYL